MPFTEEDAEYFAGREQEAKVVFSNLCAAQLTVFFGPSGVGKSSLLQAGVVPLVRQSRACGTVVYFRAWQSSRFLAELKTACIREAKLSQPELVIDPSLPLDALLTQLARALRRPIFVLLDQFEDYLQFGADSPEAKEFEPELASAVNDQRVPAHFLIGIREDALSKLDRLDMHIANLLGNTLRLRPVSREGAEAALREPLAKFNEHCRNRMPPVTLDDALVNEVLSNISTDKAKFSDAGEGSGKSVAPGKSGVVELTYLQLVMTRLWETELKQGSLRLRRDTLVRRLGGTAAVVRTYLDKLMRVFTESEQQACARIFNLLVTSSGNKVAYAAQELVEHSRLGLPELTQLLEKLARVGVLREVPTAEGELTPERRFEIQHNKLAAAVLDWRKRFVIEQQLDRERGELKRRMRRRFGVAAVCALAAGAISVGAYRDRTNKRELEVAKTALGEMRALVIAARLIDAANGARVKATATVVTPSTVLGEPNPDEERARRLLRQAAQLYRDQIPKSLDQKPKDRIDAALILPELRRYLDFRSVSSLSFSADGSMIAVGTEEGQVAIVPRDPKRLPMYAPSQAGGFLALGFRSPSEPVAVRRGPTKSKLRALEPVAAAEPSGVAPRSLELSQWLADAKSGNNVVILDGKAQQIAVFGSDGRLRIQDLATRRDVWVSPTPDGEVSSVDLVTRGTEMRLAYATVAGQLRTLSIEGGIPARLTERSVHAMGRTLVALASNSSQFAFATANGHDISWWAGVAATTAIPLETSAETQTEVRKLAVSVDGKRVAALREGGLVSVWNVESTPELVFEYDFPFPRFDAAFSPDLSYIALFANRGLFLYKLKQRQSGKNQPPPDVGLHADEYAWALGDFVPALKTGVTAANDGRIADAVDAFRKSFEYPGVDFDARTEALRVRMLAIGQMLMKEVLAGKDVGELARILAAEIDRAGPDASALKHFAPLVDPVMAQAYLARAVSHLVEPKQLQASDPQFRTYLEVFADLKTAEDLNPNAPVPAVYWNNLCWYGTLAGYARELVDAGERAVRQAPADAGVRDTRGISRALTGNTAGALADFRFFVEDASVRVQLSQATVGQRRQWISELSSKRNPFTKSAVERLRNE